MILGICVKPDGNDLKTVADAGYRYVETWLPNLFGGENKEKYENFLRALDKNKIRCEVGQFAFPGEYDPSGAQSETALEKIRDYVFDLLNQTRGLNIERLVIGAGGARVLPSPELYKNAEEQMAEILKRAVSPALDGFGAVAVIEGLVKKETTILNTTEQTVSLAKLAGLPNIKVMTDLYHAANEGEDFGDYKKFTGYILHSHIGKPVPRVMPSPGDGQDYAPFFAALRSAGFDGRMSVEAGKSCDDYKTSVENAYKVLEPLL